MIRRAELIAGQRFNIRTSRKPTELRAARVVVPRIKWNPCLKILWIPQSPTRLTRVMEQGHLRTASSTSQRTNKPAQDSRPSNNARVRISVSAPTNVVRVTRERWRSSVPVIVFMQAPVLSAE